MKYTICFILVLFSFVIGFTQSFSHLYILPDTQNLQSSYWIEHNENLYNYRNVFCYGQDNPFDDFYPSVNWTRMDKSGSVIWDEQVKDNPNGSEGFYQVFATQPMVIIGDQIISASLFRDPLFNQKSALFSWNNAGLLDWRSAPQIGNNTYLIADQIIPIPSENAFYQIGILQTTTVRKIACLKHSTTGQIADSIFFDIPEYNDNLDYYVVDASLNGGYFTVGLDYLNLDTGASGHLLIYFSENGQLEWYKSYGKTYSWVMLAQQDGVHVQNVVVANNLSSIQSCHDYFDLSGTSIASTCVEYSSPLDTIVRPIFQILPQPNSSDYYLIGIEFNPLVNLPGSNFVERYNSNGNLIWKKIYIENNPDHTFPLSFSSGSSITPEGNLLISGLGYIENSGVPPYGTTALWVLNLDENGCFNGICTDTIWTKSLLISETKERKWEKGISIYPNPTSNFFQIEFDYKDFNTLRVFDSLGRLTYSTTNMNSPTTIFTHNWQSGMYYVQISDNKSAKNAYFCKRIYIQHP